MSRTGRRPGAPETREAIVGVARRHFASRGYDATSLRSIAAEAKVDPALLIHYFGTKEGLLVAAAGLPAHHLFEPPGELEPPSLEGAVETLVRAYLQFADSDESRNAVLALVRSAVSNETAATMLRQFLTTELLEGIARLTGRPDARLRACLVAAQLVGLAMLRHVVRVGPLAEASPDELAGLVAPVLEGYLR